MTREVVGVGVPRFEQHGFVAAGNGNQTDERYRGRTTNGCYLLPTVCASELLWSDPRRTVSPTPPPRTNDHRKKYGAGEVRVGQWWRVVCQWYL